MATLIGTVPPSLTFQDLVGGTGTRKPSSLLPAPEQDSATSQDRTARDPLMRIYLPERVVRVMALTRHDEFLLSYSIQDNRSAAEVADRENGGTGKINAARKPGPSTPVLDRETQDRIGQQLRAMYEDLLEKPVPGHLLVFMARLERRNRGQGDAC